MPDWTLAVYHVMSRTALDGFPLKDIEKDFMLDLIRRYSSLYLAEILCFCLMDNHFHILVRMFPEHKFRDEDIKKRYEAFYGDDRVFAAGQIPSLREKLSNLSEFVREIKVGFTRYYNKRHNRRGYFWGDRFKSVIVEKGETLINCLAYIDLNMVRAGVVLHPGEWMYGGYNDIQNPKQRYSLINRQKPRALLGIKDDDQFSESHRKWVEEVLKNGTNQRDAKWTESIAVGDKKFVMETKAKLGAKAMGRKALENSKGYELKEPQSSYNHVFAPEKRPLRLKNDHFWQNFS